MTVFSWVAVLVGVWCVLSLAAALGLGALMARGSTVDDDIVVSRHARGELSDGALAMWLAGASVVPATPAALLTEVPAPREGRQRSMPIAERTEPSTR